MIDDAVPPDRPPDVAVWTTSAIVSARRTPPRWRRVSPAMGRLRAATDQLAEAAEIMAGTRAGAVALVALEVAAGALALELDRLNPPTERNAPAANGSVPAGDPDDERPPTPEG